MELTEILSLWWVYPASVCIATIAISNGISGALFFAPFFLLVVGLPPAEAIGGGLMTMIFGTGSGTFSYTRQHVVDFTIVKSLLVVTVPLAMLGALVALIVDADALRVALGAGLIALAAFLLWNNLRRPREPQTPSPLRGGRPGWGESPTARPEPLTPSRRSREGGNPDEQDRPSPTARPEPVEGPAPRPSKSSSTPVTAASTATSAPAEPSPR